MLIWVSKMFLRSDPNYLNSVLLITRALRPLIRCFNLSVKLFKLIIPPPPPPGTEAVSSPKDCHGMERLWWGNAAVSPGYCQGQGRGPDTSTGQGSTSHQGRALSQTPQSRQRRALPLSQTSQSCQGRALSETSQSCQVQVLSQRSQSRQRRAVSATRQSRQGRALSQTSQSCQVRVISETSTYVLVKYQRTDHWSK